MAGTNSKCQVYGGVHLIEVSLIGELGRVHVLMLSTGKQDLLEYLRGFSFKRGQVSTDCIVRRCFCLQVMFNLSYLLQIVVNRNKI